MQQDVARNQCSFRDIKAPKSYVYRPGRRIENQSKIGKIYFRTMDFQRMSKRIMLSYIRTESNTFIFVYAYRFHRTHESLKIDYSFKMIDANKSSNKFSPKPCTAQRKYVAKLCSFFANKTPSVEAMHFQFILNDSLHVINLIKNGTGNM